MAQRLAEHGVEGLKLRLPPTGRPVRGTRALRSGDTPRRQVCCGSDARLQLTSGGRAVRRLLRCAVGYEGWLRCARRDHGPGLHGGRLCLARSSIANNKWATEEGDDEEDGRPWKQPPTQVGPEETGPEAKASSDLSAAARAAASASLPPEARNEGFGTVSTEQQAAKTQTLLAALAAHAAREGFDYATKLEGGGIVVTLDSLGRELAAACCYLGNEELNLVADGLLLAFRAHLNQRRKSGEPYIIHPVAVAVILGELRMDHEAVIAGLLHDTVEDTDMVTFEVVDARFGRRIRNIVEGETRVSKLKNFTSEAAKGDRKTDVKADDLQQMFFAMTDEVGVIVVKLADRLHNMRTLDHMPPHKQTRIARETLEVFAPLAHLLGLHRIKVELEDLAFRYGNPEAYARTVRRLDELATEQEEVVLLVKQKLLEAYDNDSYSQLMVRRPTIEITTKTPYSIYKRAMDRGGKDKANEEGTNGNSKVLDALYDSGSNGASRKGGSRNSNIQDIRNVVQLTIILESKSSLEVEPHATLEEKNRARRATTQVCYHFLGLIHEMWPPIPGSLKDYIAMPKPNGYQSLHTRVLPRSVLNEISTSGKAAEASSSRDDFRENVKPDKRCMLFPIELQIRTKEQNSLAEYGIAAQVQMDREQGTLSMEFEDGGDWNRRVSWLDSIREWQKEFVDGMSAREFVDTVTGDLFGRRVFVFTPKGKVMNLPRGSTVVDYAYHIHTQVGNTMLFSKVNGAMVPPSYVLDYADVVDVVCHTSATPKMVRIHQTWLPHAKTKSARHKLLKFIRENQHMLGLEKEDMDMGIKRRKLPLNDDEADAISAAAELAINAAADFDAAACMMTGTPLDACRADKYSPDKSSTNAGWEALLQNYEATAEVGSNGRAPGNGAVTEREKREFIDSITSKDEGDNGASKNGFKDPRSDISSEDRQGSSEQLDLQQRQEAATTIPMDGSWFGVETYDRNGLLAEVSTVLTKNGLSILAYSGSQRTDGSGLGRMVFELAGEVDMEEVCRSISQIDSVRSWSCGCILGKASDPSQNGNNYM